MNYQSKKSFLCTVLLSAYIAGNVFGAQPATTAKTTAVTKNQNEQSTQSAVSLLPSVPSAANFVDISPDKWYFPYVDALVNRGVINGTSPMTFSPNGTFSVAECCVVITRYLGLEQDAKKRQADLQEQAIEGSNLWYCGYIQLMYDAGILTLPELIADRNGLIALTRETAERPIKRYEFADCIANSFDLSQQSIRAKNVYTEIGGLGHEFICSGVYDMACVNTYSLLISDFEQIPDASRTNVLKCYYNGIFNGDVSGNFYPDNNLTRSEMAKVIATVTDYSFRTRLAVPNLKSMVLNDSDYFTNASGDKRLKNYAVQSILQNQAMGITAKNGIAVCKQTYTCPMGYAVDTYIFSKDSAGVCTLLGQSTLNSESDGLLDVSYGQSGKVLLILRNLSENSRAEAQLELTLTYDGIQQSDFCLRKPQKIEIIENT